MNSNEGKEEFYLPKDKFTDLYFIHNEPDLEVHIKDEIIKVHKMVLMHSEIFKNMLLDCKQTNFLTIDCDSKIFKIVIDILSYKITKKEVNSTITFDDLIKLINLLDYLNIHELIDVFEKKFNEYELKSENMYEIYKTIKYKPIKNICLHKIFNDLDPPGSREKLVKIIDNCDNMMYIIQEGRKKNTPELYIYAIVLCWIKIHNSKENKQDSENINKLLSMVDISKFKLRDLIKYSRRLLLDYGEKFTTILLKKLHSNIYDVKKEVGTDASLNMITLGVSEDDECWEILLASSEYILIKN